LGQYAKAKMAVARVFCGLCDRWGGGVAFLQQPMVHVRVDEQIKADATVTLAAIQEARRGGGEVVTLDQIADEWNDA